MILSVKMVEQFIGREFLERVSSKMHEEKTRRARFGAVLWPIQSGSAVYVSAAPEDVWRTTEHLWVSVKPNHKYEWNKNPLC